MPIASVISEIHLHNFVLFFLFTITSASFAVIFPEMHRFCKMFVIVRTQGLLILVSVESVVLEICAILHNFVSCVQMKTWAE
jgi:hypothetical protein